MRNRPHPLHILLRDFGYEYTGNALERGDLIERSTRFTSRQLVGRFNSIYAAIDHLRPRLADAEFTARFIAYCDRQPT